MCGLYVGEVRMSVVSWKSDLYSTYIFVVLFALSCDTGQSHYNKPDGIDTAFKY